MKIRTNFDDETFIGESTYYFEGEVEHDDFPKMQYALVEMGVDTKHIG